MSRACASATAAVVRGDDGGARRGPDRGHDDLPARGRDPWAEPVYAATHILNGYGELIGINSIREWGILESPIVLTSSLLIGKAYDATVQWIAGRDGDAGEAVMPCVTECDDSWLSDGAHAAGGRRGRLGGARGGRRRAPWKRAASAPASACSAFDFKGGIGTSSRVLPEAVGGYAVGVLVMTNHGDREVLLIDGVRVGEQITDRMPEEHTEGFVHRGRRHRRAAATGRPQAPFA